MDTFISSNQFVIRLLSDQYKIINPSEIVPEDKKIFLKASRVRYEMATYGKWKELVPKKVADYLEKNFLVERFRAEFGLETIAYFAENDIMEKEESASLEQLHAQGVL